MSSVGEAMLAELKRIREQLEGVHNLGFGKRAQLTYVFVRHHEVNGETYLWYSREKSEGLNVPIRERDLTGYLKSIWRFDRGDESTGEVVPKLNIQIRADKDYIVQTGFATNFARTFLAGLLELELEALAEPITLVVEDNAGSKARATVFCRIESKGVRMTPSVNREISADGLYNEARAKFSFTDPYSFRKDE